MKAIHKSYLVFLISLFSLSVFAEQTNMNQNNANDEKVVEYSEPEDADIFNCTLECQRKCEKKELEAVDCSNNGCKCGPG